MPGLLRGMARTAVVAGTATAVSNRVSRRQGNRWAQQDEQQQYEQAPPPAPAAAPDAVSEVDLEVSPLDVGWREVVEPTGARATLHGITVAGRTADTDREMSLPA